MKRHLYYIVILITIWCTTVCSSHFTASSNETDFQTKYCRKPAVCEKLNYSTCYGVRLPYTSTSITHIADVESQDDVQKKLTKWKGLMQIPRCWSAIQPFLCALYMPKCEDGLVDLPSKEMCELIQSPCSILLTDGRWPNEFRCNASYESYCANDVRDLKFNTAGECKAPLVKTNDETSFYEGIEGCGVQCHDPFFDDEERQNIRSTIKWSFSIACLCNGFAVMTYLLTRPFASKFPAQAVFWMNFCFFIVSLGFLWQFFNSNDRTICHADGTLRTLEPSRENLSCVTNFVFVYSFLVSGVIWCEVFAYTWFNRSQTYDKVKNRRDEWSSYYHTLSWSIPTVLTVIAAAFQLIDGDGLLGICFVNKNMRLTFLVGPLLSLIVACIFLVRCIFKLFHLKRTSSEVMSERAKKKVRESIYKLILFLFSILLFISITTYCQYYEWKNYPSWKESFRSYLVCRLGVVGNVAVDDCRMRRTPNVSLVQLQLWTVAIFSISVAGWIFTASSIAETWKRFILKTILRKEIEENLKLKKYKVIARAYEKRDGCNSDGVMSIDLRKSVDPVDLDFDLNSIGSNENSSWAKIIPHLMKRRVAIVPNTHSRSEWKNSTDSEISYSVRRVSVESRRNSCESMVSIQAVEVTETVHKRPHNRRRRKHKRRTRSASFTATSKQSTNGGLFPDNDLEAEVLKALKIGPATKRVQQQSDEMNRRMAISNIEESTLKLLGMGRKILDQQCTDSGSQSDSDSSVVSDRSKSVKSEVFSDTISLQDA